MKTKLTLFKPSWALSKIFLLLVSLFALSTVQAQIPNLIPYQGQISDTSGKGFDGNFDFSFQILDNNSNSLWSSGTLKLDVFDGAYSVNLGENPQPSLPKDLVQNDILFLEISFNDGTKGMETLAPNVQILPVPFALRAGIADSAKSSSGELAWGDSLVLRDASGDVRFVINPNTGEFKAVQKDTSWYKLTVNSPPKIEKKNGDGGETEEAVEANGKNYTKHTLMLAGLRIEKWVQHDRDLGNQDTLEVTYVYDGNCLRTKIVQYYKVSTGRTREVRYTYDCPSGKPKGISDRAIAGDDEEGTVEENKETFTKTTKKTSEGRLQAATVDTRTGNLVAATFSPKDSCYIINADKFILSNDSTEYTIRLNKNGTISAEAKSKKSGQALPPLMELMDPLEQVIIEQGMKEVKYKYISAELVRIYEQAGLPDEIIELINASAESYVTDGINNLKRLVDSVLVYKVTSKSVKDSIQILYDAVGHIIEVEGAEKYKQLWSDLVYIRTLGPDMVILEQFIDEGSGFEMQRQMDLKNGKDVLEGAKGSDIIQGGDEFTETHSTPTGSNTIAETFKPDSNALITSGLNHEINRVLESDSFTRALEEVDAAGTVKNRIAVVGIPGDSTFLYDGGSRIIRRIDDGDFTEVHEYDANSNRIVETTNPADSTKKIVGVRELIFDDVQRENHRTSSGEFSEKYTYDANSNVIEERTRPRDSTKIFIDTRRLLFQGTDQVIFEFDGSSNGTFVAYDPNNRLVINGGIKTAEWDFDSAIAGLYNNGTITGLNFSNPRTNNAVGFGFDPDGRAVFLQANGKATFASDTLMAQDQLRAGSLDVGGNAFVNGNMNVLGNISKGGGTFKIDHPQDPYNKYLYHSFIESPDMMNIYNGNTKTDSLGFDTIQLPGYFNALNKDFRYQLTCIGSFAQAIVKEEIKGNYFVIQTSEPGVKVSWQVTGVRRDNYANENRVQVEVEKSASEKGTLLYPPKLDN